MNNDLYHHGIKGQKWGVRRFQNKDGSLTPAGEKRYYVESNKKESTNKDGSITVPKGYKFNRVGQASLDINKSGGLYVSSGKADAARYMKMLGPTPLTKFLGTATTHMQHIEVVDDIKKPSVKETCKLTTQFLTKNPKEIADLSNSLGSMFIDEEITDKTLANAKRNPTGKDAERLAFVMSSMLGDSQYKDVSVKLYDYFRKNGYDAIPDLHDTMTGRSATATIIINPDKVKVTSTTKLTKDVMKEGKQYVKTLSKLPIGEIIIGGDDNE